MYYQQGDNITDTWQYTSTVNMRFVRTSLHLHEDSIKLTANFIEALSKTGRQAVAPRHQRV